MPGFRLLDLPLDILRRVSATLESSAIVVACSSRERDAERRVLRRGADDYERERWDGEPGLTIHEAGIRLLGWLPLPYNLSTVWPVPEGLNRCVTADDLATRVTCGRLLVEVCCLSIADNLDVGLVTTLLAYGAKPDMPFRGSPNAMTALHAVAISGFGLDVARPLVKAGANLHARSTDLNNMGETPLAWCMGQRDPPTDASLTLDDQSLLRDRFKLAVFLIENGADETEIIGSRRRRGTAPERHWRSLADSNTQAQTS